MEFTKLQIEKLILGVHLGKINEYNLPKDLYFAIADYLKIGIYQGFGTNLNDLTKSVSDGNGSIGDLELLNELRTNIYMFSGAKVFQQINEMSLASRLITDEGVIKPFAVFKKEALAIYEQYNVDWLKTEYNTAIGQAQEAIKWQKIEEQKDVLPYLEYSAVIDSKTSEICRPLDGIIAPVGDPIWKKIAPLNHFNCRCLILQLDKEEGEKRQTGKLEKLSKVQETESKMQDVFKMNAGMDGYIFNKNHPYFKVQPKDIKYAQNNFNLPIPPKDAPIKTQISKKAVLPKFTPADTIKQAQEYAKNVLGVQYANYKGVNIDLANDMNKGLFNTKMLMPELKVGGIGSAQEVNKQIKNDVIEGYRQSEYYKAAKEKYGLKGAEYAAERTAKQYYRRVENGILAWSSNTPNAKFGDIEVDLSKYKGVFINANEAKSKSAIDTIVQKSSERGWFTKGAKDFTYIMDHELGHEIDKMLNFRNDEDFKKIFDREHKAGIKVLAERLSTYGATAGNKISARPAEMIAEAWAEFVTSENPRELSAEIGELMLKKYYLKFKPVSNTASTFEEWKYEAIKLIQK